MSQIEDIEARVKQARWVAQWGQPWPDFYDSVQEAPYSFRPGPRGKDQALADLEWLLAERARLQAEVTHAKLSPGKHS